MTSSEVMKMSGATLRQLQWWDEHGILKPVKKGRRRIYTKAQAEQAIKIAQARKLYRPPLGSETDLAMRRHPGEVVLVRPGEFVKIGGTLIVGAGSKHRAAYLNGH